MDEIITIEAKHIFIDIVNYTYRRSVEAQSEIIKVLNRIVNETINDFQLDRQSIIFIPTGDGMCISLLNISSPYDIHIQIGLGLLKKLDEYNNFQTNEMRRFSIRIGINENIDNLITDINNNRNISGSGINMASRIEGLGDENQILVGSSVYDKLVNREKYINSFVSFEAVVKHEVALNIHQYINKDLPFLNSSIPLRFRTKIPETKKLSVFAGYYLANCIKHEDFIISKIGNSLDASALHILIYFLTQDSISKSKTTTTDPSFIQKIKVPLNDFFDELKKSNHWLSHEIRHHLIPIKIEGFDDCFKETYLLVHENGITRLKQEQPDIFNSIYI